MPSVVNDSTQSYEPRSGYVTLEEAGEILRLSRPTLLGCIKRGELDARRFGRQWRIPLEAVEPRATKGTRHY